MARDELGIGRHHAQHLFAAGDHAGDAAAVFHVHEGKSIGNEIIAHMHHVGLGKKDDAIAIGVARGKVDGADVFTVQVHGGAVIEGDDGQHAVRCRRCGVFKQFDGAAGSQPLAHVFLRDDGSQLGEIRISAGVVAVVVRVDDETHRLVGDAFERRLDLGRQRGELIVDHNDAIVAD